LASAALVSAAYERERQRAEEAEAQFRLARKAVDELIQVSEQELADKPYLNKLRKRLLESALVYYQEFIQQRGDDAAAKADLVATREHVKKILADLALLQGAGQVYLLSQPAVLDDLSLSQEQRKKVGELLFQLGMQRVQSFRNFSQLSPEQREQRFLDLARTEDAAVRKILAPEQLGRLGQIALQLQGPGALREPDVAAALKLTAQQKERIRAIEAESFIVVLDRTHFGGSPQDFRKVLGAVLGAAGALMHPGRPPEIFPRTSELRIRGTNERILMALTEEQRKQWGEMTGEPLKGSVPFCLPPGPFGPSGGPLGPGGLFGRGGGPKGPGGPPGPPPR
jgi:hypothetical protein